MGDDRSAREKICHAEHVVIAMSGNFVQRGAPALMEKYSRAAMALNCGADLVLELPALFATASAEAFAIINPFLFEYSISLPHEDSVSNYIISIALLQRAVSSCFFS